MTDRTTVTSDGHRPQPNRRRSLFERDKLLFAFLMAIHVGAHVARSLDLAQLRWLLTGGIGGAGGGASGNPVVRL